MKDKIKKLKIEVLERNVALRRIKQLNKELKEELEKNNILYNIEKGDRVFVECLTYSGKVRTYNGLFIEEGRKHIKIEIWDHKIEKYYSYIISKGLISGMKIYAKE